MLRQANKLNVCEHNEGQTKYNKATQLVFILMSKSDTFLHLLTNNHVVTHKNNNTGGATPHNN
jgi:hypothetical protein